MSLQDILTGQCGDVNPIVALSSQFHTDMVRRQEDLSLDREGFASNGEVAPSTFDMQSLLQQMKGLERPANMSSVQVPSDQVHKEVAYREANIPTDQQASFVKKPLPAPTSSQFHNRTSNGDYFPPQFSAMRLPFTQHALFYGQPFHEQIHDERTGNAEFWEQEFKLPHEYLEELDNSEQLVQNYSNSLGIMDLVDDIGTMDNLNLKVDDDSILNAFDEQSGILANKWVQEFHDENKESTEITVPQESIEAETKKSEYALTKQDEGYWNDLRTEWEEMFTNQFQDEQILDSTKQDYEFSEEPSSFGEGAFDEGKRKLAEGDLIGAILMFEEAVQFDDNHAEAWKYLGTSQAENEHEKQAIAALNKCLALHPDDQDARLELAVSYTNESLQVQACETLRAWIQNHPRYGHVVASGAHSNTEAASKSGYSISSIVNRHSFDEVHEMFLAAARISPDHDIDADVQLGLGVLFNLSGDYEKAIDCFQAGLQVRNDSASLWNKLGATLANSGKSDEAVEAYTNALHLRPSFLRCRYNLAISCINLKAYPQAVDHLLETLNIQKRGSTGSGGSSSSATGSGGSSSSATGAGASSTMSDSIWSTLRMCVSLLGRAQPLTTELLRAVDARDLHRLNEEFGGEDGGGS